MTQGMQLLTALQKRTGFSHSSFEGGPRREISRPIAVIITRVGKEIVCLCWPSLPDFVQGFKITTGCRMKQIHATVQLVRVTYHFVHVFEIHLGCHKLKITAPFG